MKNFNSIFPRPLREMARKRGTNAFTLAEVLVTLGVVGVVTAMTLPAFLRNHQQQVLTTQLRKVTSELSLMFERYLSDQRVETLAESDIFDSKDARANFLRHYLKIDKEGEYTACSMYGYKNIGDKDTFFNSDLLGDASCAILTGGASVCINKYNTSDKKGFVGIVLDVNGKEGPNLCGRDYFVIDVNNDGKLTYNDSDEMSTNSTACNTYYYKKIVENGWKMNY